MTLPHGLIRSAETANGRNSGPAPSLVAPAVPTNSDPAYIRGRAEFASVFSDLAKGKRNWQLAAFGTIGIAVVLAVGVVGLATTSRITPYVVEVDKLGRAQAVGPADQLGTVDQRVIVSQLAGFVRDIRTVLADPAAQGDLVRRAYGYVDQGAAPFLNAYYAVPANDPRLLGRELTRLVTVTSVLPLPSAASRTGSTTWKIAWTETAIPRAAGGAAMEAAWEGYFTTRLLPPATVERITLNPLGLYVTSINWTQLATTERRSPDESPISSPTGVVP